MRFYLYCVYFEVYTICLLAFGTCDKSDTPHLDIIPIEQTTGIRNQVFSFNMGDH